MAVAVEIEKVKTTSEGGLALPEEFVEKKQMNITEGVVAAVADFAFAEIQQGRYPKIGDKVYFKKFSGILHSDKDTGKEYRIVQDTDIYGIEESMEVSNG